MLRGSCIAICGPIDLTRGGTRLSIYAIKDTVLENVEMIESNPCGKPNINLILNPLCGCVLEGELNLT